MTLHVMSIWTDERPVATVFGERAVAMLGDIAQEQVAKVLSGPAPYEFWASIHDADSKLKANRLSILARELGMRVDILHPEVTSEQQRRD